MTPLRPGTWMCPPPKVGERRAKITLFARRKPREGKEPDSRIDMERPAGIEPAALAWEARVLPLYEGRLPVILARVSRRLNTVVA